MKKVLTLIIIPFLTFGQSLTVINPSFEGQPGAGITPAPWSTCMFGQTPDTQPGSWGVNLPASEGATYLGFVHDVPINWQEGATQELVDAADQTTPAPLTAGNNYQFTIDIAGFELTSGVTFSPNAELLIYGGFVACPQNELLWSSGDTPDNVWTTYTVSFTPSASYTYIMLQINVLDPSGYGSILVDNMGPIIPQCQLLDIDDMGASCEGDNGFIETVIVDNGSSTPPFNYIWSNGETTPNIYNLSPGVYDLEVTDSNGDCVTYLSQEITGIELIGTPVDPTCTQTNDGTISVSLSGGGSPYQYLWSNGETSQNISNLAPGSYSVTVTDAYDCVITEQFTLSAEPILLTASGDACNENFDVSISGPTTFFEEWVLLEYPEDAPVPNFADIYSSSTQFSIYEEGEYVIGAIICGDTVQQSLSIDEFINVIHPIYQHCILSADIGLFPSNGTLELLAGPGEATISDSSPNITVEEFGLYAFQYTACNDRIFNFSIAFGCPPVIPNVLTINDDQNNDLFTITLLSSELYDESIFTVYNRWGQIVFMAPKYAMNDDWWDGTHFKTNKKVSSGTYYYTLELFHNTKDQKDLFTGYIEILND